MNKTEDMIWDYLDGQGNQEERAEVEARLSTDQNFRELFLESRLLHESLQKLEVAVPSLRFSHNIMDRLPAVRELATEPLVSKKWFGIFTTGILGLIAFIFGSSAIMAPAVSGQVPSNNNLLDQFLQVFDLIPLNTLLFGGIIGICLLSLLLLDRWLQARFQG